MNILAILIFLSGLFLITIGYYRQLLSKNQTEQSSKDLSNEQLREVRDNFIMDSLNVTNTYEPIFLPTDVWFRRGIDDLNNIYKDTMKEKDFKKEVTKEYFKCSEHNLFKKKQPESEKVITLDKNGEFNGDTSSQNIETVYQAGKIEGKQTNNFAVACAMTCGKKNQNGKREDFQSFSDFKKSWGDKQISSDKILMKSLAKNASERDSSCECIGDTTDADVFQCGPLGKGQLGSDYKRGLTRSSQYQINIYNDKRIRETIRKIFNYKFLIEMDNGRLQKYYKSPTSFINRKNAGLQSFQFSKLPTDIQNLMNRILEIDGEIQYLVKNPETTPRPTITQQA